MRPLAMAMAGLVLLMGLAGFLSVGSGLLGGVVGAGAVGGGYEYHLEAPKGSCGS